MRILSLIVLIACLSGCAVTHVKFNSDGTLAEIRHSRFIISEEFHVIGREGWSAECKSKPDEASVALAKGLVDLATKAGATP